MINVNDNVKQNLIFLRKQRKLTQIELAESIGYSDKTVSKWETGESVPNVETLVALADFYGVSLDTLTKGSVDDLVENNKQSKTICKRLIKLINGLYNEHYPACSHPTTGPIHNEDQTGNLQR